MKKLNLIFIVFLGISLYWLSTPVELVAILYLATLSVLQIPMVITSVVSGFNNIKKKGFLLNNIIGIFITIIISAVLTISIGLIIKSIDLKPEIITSFKFNLPTLKNSNNLSLYFPNNIYSALISGNILVPLIIFTILGLSIRGINNRPIRSKLFLFTDSAFLAVDKMTQIIGLLFPVGFLAITIYSFNSLDFVAIKTFSSILLVPVLFLIILFYITLGIVSFKTKNSIRQTFFSIIRTFLLTLVSGSRLVSLPFFISDSIGSLKLESSKVKIISPFYFSLIKIGDISIYTFLTLLICRMYDIQISLVIMLVIYFTSLVASFFSLNGGVFITMPILAFLCRRLGIPADPIYVFFLSIGLILNPIREGLNCLFAFIHLSIVDGLSDN